MPIRRPSPATDFARARRPIRNSTSACFSAKGESFDPDIVTAASQPMLCGRSAGEYRAYLPRARWIRDANDSYFAAMTYPRRVAVFQPARRYPRRDLGRSFRGLWRRGASVAPKAMPRWRMRPWPAAASVLQLDAGVPEAARSRSRSRRARAERVNVETGIGRGRRRSCRQRAGAMRAPARWSSSGRPGLAFYRRRRCGFIAAACAGRYFATMAGSSWAIAVSGNRVQVSSLPNSEIPQ